MLTKGRSRLVACAGILCWATASGAVQAPQIRAEVREVVITYLQTDCEIDNGRRTLEEVLKVRDEATPFLVSLLEQGPDADMQAQFDRALDQQWQERQRFLQESKASDLGLSEEQANAARAHTEQQYKDQARSDFATKLRQRAATALGEIGTDEARQALQRVLEASGTDEELRQAIRSALGRPRQE